MTLEEVRQELFMYGLVRPPENRVSVRLKEGFDVRINVPPELKLRFSGGMQPDVIEAGRIGKVGPCAYTLDIFDFKKECPVKFSHRRSIIGVPWELLEIVN